MPPPPAVYIDGCSPGMRCISSSPVGPRSPGTRSDDTEETREFIIDTLREAGGYLSLSNIGQSLLAGVLYVWV
jgi:hypothetical protein